MGYYNSACIVTEADGKVNGEKTLDSRLRGNDCKKALQALNPLTSKTHLC